MVHPQEVNPPSLEVLLGSLPIFGGEGMRRGVETEKDQMLLHQKETRKKKIKKKKNQNCQGDVTTEANL